MNQIRIVGLLLLIFFVAEAILAQKGTTPKWGDYLGELSWDDAVAQCQALEMRLPKIDEFKKLGKNVSLHCVPIDSYKNVGCTNFSTPFSTIPIFQGKFVSVPYASELMKFPHLPIPCESANIGAIQSNKFSTLILDDSYC